ncbi:MAG TPA: hypothetical protein VE338_04985 [Ktedonobacterales bacterium]|jgi:hypothetical protein|nr:hypothetical protein [Ktedonobacterales bacterium]
MTPQTIEETTQSAMPASAQSSSRVQALLHEAGGGAWIREASRTLALAAQANVHLDDETLIYSDVRDLMALQWRLRSQQGQQGPRQ